MNPEPIPPFLLGLNPYGVAYTVGLQAGPAARANPHPVGLEGFLGIAREIGAQCIELDHRWLTPRSDDELARLGERLGGTPRVVSFWLSQTPGETLDEAIRCAAAVGAPLIRLHLTPVLEGSRARLGRRWHEMVAHAERTLARESPRVADAGLTMAIENHQDFGSDELVTLAERLGNHVGIVLDTGNPFAVAEDPVAFTRRAAHRIRHVHLKDYVAQFTADGYRLIRCAIGDGAVPFRDMAAVLASSSVRPLTASIEPGALESRHIRALAGDWWQGYRGKDEQEFATMIGRLEAAQLGRDADGRTPWERDAPPEEIVAYERDQLLRSVENLRAARLVLA